MKLELVEYVHTGLPKGWKPYYIYHILVDSQCVGTIVLREGTLQERYYDGHIGYTIEKPYQGHHYSLQACFLIFEKAKELNMKQLIITCSPENRASHHIIQHLPARYIETVSIPKQLKKYFTKEETHKKVYLIQLEEV